MRRVVSSRLLLASLLFVLAGSAWVGGAEARKQGDVAYPFQQVWNAGLRMLRVDLRLPVTDRDAEAGYMLFDYIDHDRHYPGSLELVRDERARRPTTKVVVKVAGMPAYVEQMLFDRLLRKLRDEYGEPLEPEKPPPEKKPKPSDPNGDGDAGIVE